MDKNIKKYTILISLLFFLFLTTNLFGEITLEPIYVLNRALMKELKPIKYPTAKKEIKGVFDFPLDDVIATNMLPDTNAVTLITFNKKKMKVKYKTVAKNFKDYVSGGNTDYMPIFSEDTIGYSQTRGFTLLNIKTKKCRYYSIIGDTDYSIGRVYGIDPVKEIFLFDMTGYKLKDQYLVRVMNLKVEGGALLKEQFMDDSIELLFTAKTIFSVKGNEVKAIDINLKETHHPIVNIINAHKEIFTEIHDIVLHPELPFGLINDKGSMWLATWKDPEKPVLVKLLGRIATRYQLTYDGKWVVFIGRTMGTSYYMLMPVLPDLPHYLGDPILLGDIPRFPSGKGITAMTRNPSGFVVCEHGWDGEKEVNSLLKWDFTEAEELIETK